MLSSPAEAELSRRDRVLIWASIAAIAALAWVYLIHLDRQMSSSMAYDKAMADMGMTMQWTAADVLFTFAMWAVMMVGMMAPSAAPVLVLFAAAQAKRRGSMGAATVMFGVGYLAVWTGFSAAAALGQWGLHRAAMLSTSMGAASPRLAGAILIAAGAYQITPWKNQCLSHCRSPLGFLMSNWRDGGLGAFRMGAKHGAYCLGCCWALMCVLFAVGVMNLVWVAALTVFVLLEKAGRGGVVVARTAGAGLVIFGISVLI